MYSSWRNIRDFQKEDRNPTIPWRIFEARDTQRVANQGWSTAGLSSAQVLPNPDDSVAHHAASRNRVVSDTSGMPSEEKSNSFNDWIGIREQNPTNKSKSNIKITKSNVDFSSWAYIRDKTNINKDNESKIINKEPNNISFIQNNSIKKEKLEVKINEVYRKFDLSSMELLNDQKEKKSKTNKSNKSNKLNNNDNKS
jgi:hypothetical protein